jgi:hypothetical protein
MEHEVTDEISHAEAATILGVSKLSLVRVQSLANTLCPRITPISRGVRRVYSRSRTEALALERARHQAELATARARHQAALAALAEST